MGEEMVVELLIQRGAVVDTRDYRGRTALHAAAAHGHYHATEVLINNGADVNARATDDEDDGWTPLFSAALEGHLVLVELLLRHGADVNACLERSHLTPLHFAAREGHTEVVELLLKHGGLPDALTNHHITPLHCATIYNHQDVIHALICGGASLSSISKAGFSAYDFAQLRGQEDVPQLLEFLDSLRSTATAPCAETGTYRCVGKGAHTTVHMSELFVTQLRLGPPPGNIG
jgi:ankyrin repeat protein